MAGSRLQRILAVPIFFILAAPLFSFTLMNEKLVFFSREEKKLEILCDRSERLQITVYRVDKGIDFVEEAWSAKVSGGRDVASSLQELPFDTDVALLSAYEGLHLRSFDLEDFRKFGVRAVRQYSQRLEKGANRIFLPVRDDGLYLVGLRTERDQGLYLMNITELSIFVKRDRTKTVVYSLDRRTGLSVSGAAILAPLDARVRRPGKKILSDETGLFSVNNSQFVRFDKIAAVISNSIDVVDAPAWQENEDEPWRAVSLIDRNFHFNDEEITVTSFFFTRDEFREYNLSAANGYSLVFGGTTNRMDATGAAVHQAAFKTGAKVRPGRYELLTVYHQSVFTNRIDIANRNDRRIFLEVRPDRVLWFFGEKPGIKVTARNFGSSVPANRGLKLKAVFVSRETRKVLKTVLMKAGLFGGQARFRLSTRGLPPDDYVVRIEADLRTVDSREIRGLAELFIFKDTEEASMTLEKRIYAVGETVPVRIELRNNIDPSRLKKAQLIVTVPSEQDRIYKKITIETKKDRTNVILSIDHAGPYRLELRYGPRDRFTTADIVWILPEKGDIPLFGGGGTEDEFTIVPDKDSYNYGDIARVLFISSRKNVDALFSFEGDSLFHYQRMAFENNYEVVDLPILEANKPNGLLRLQSMVSNRFLSVFRMVLIPYSSKRIQYEIGVTPETASKKIFVTTENVFSRPVPSYNLINLSGSFWSVDPQPDTFGWLYPFNKDKVVLYGFPASDFDNRGKDESGEIFRASAPDASALYVLPSVPVFLSLLTESSTNRLTVTDSEFNGLDRIQCRYRSVTADGKIGQTNQGLELSGSIRRETLFPDYLHPEDRAGFCVYLQNLQDFSKKVRLSVEFNSRDDLLFQTNTLILAPGRDGSRRFPFPPVLRKASGFRCKVKVISQEFSAENRHDVYVLAFPFRSVVTPALSIKKRYTVYGRDLGAFLFPRSPVCHMEDIIRVTLQVRVRDRFWMAQAATNNASGIVIGDVIPSGCRILNSGPESSPGFMENDRICFRLPEGRDRITLVYYLRAELPGRYAVFPSIVSAAGADYLTRKSRAPTGAVTVLY